MSPAQAASSLLPAVRHFEDASVTPLCSIWEADGAVGGSALLWDLAHACTRPCTSLVVLPQLIGDSQHNSMSPRKTVANMTTISLHDDDDVQSKVEQAVKATETHPRTPHRLVIVECASTLSMLQGFEALTKLLNYLRLCPHVHGIIALLRAGMHPQIEIDRINRLCSCLFMIKPARALPSDQALGTPRPCVHVEAFMSLLRHSGTAA